MFFIAAINRLSKSELKELAGRVNHLKTSILDDIRNNKIKVPPLKQANKYGEMVGSVKDLQGFHAFIRGIFMARCKDESIGLPL